MGGAGIWGKAWGRWDENMIEWGREDTLATDLLLSPFPFTHFLISPCPLGSELLLWPQTGEYCISILSQREDTLWNHSLNSDPFPHPQTHEIRFLKWVTQRKHCRGPFLRISPPLWCLVSSAFYSWKRDFLCVLNKAAEFFKAAHKPWLLC